MPKCLAPDCRNVAVDGRAGCAEHHDAIYTRIGRALKAPNYRRPKDAAPDVPLPDTVTVKHVEQPAAEQSKRHGRITAEQLREYLQEHGRTSGADLAGHFGVGVRTISRHAKAAGITAAEGRRGGYSVEPPT